MRAMSLLLAAAACLGCAVTPVLARETPPEPAPPRPLVLPEHDTITLDNGLEVTFIEFGDVPKVTVSAVVRAGALNEGRNAWLARLTAQMLGEGTTQRSASEVAVAAANMGGQLATGAGDDETSATLDVLSEYGPDAVALLAEVLTQPAFAASEFDRIRQDALRSLSVARTQPQALAGEAFRSALYGEHPYGIVFPSEAQLGTYAIEDVRRFYEANYGAERTHLYVAGRFDRAAMEQAIRESFGTWRRGPQILVDIPEPSDKAQVRLISRPGAPQSTIYLGLPVIDPQHPDFMALSVMNTLLGGSFASRITSNIREDKGYTYSPNSSFATRYRDTAWVQAADVTTQHTGAALAEIYKEIDRLRQEPPSAAELEATQNYRNGIFLLSNATAQGLLGQLAFVDLHELPDDWLTTFVDRLYAVTPEDVTRVARQYLDPRAMTLVVVGDLDVVRPQIDVLDYLEDVAIN
ncbi:MAG TPA: pitrilysin family protein [Steroidobacteraceae bacterium]|nr:pitrilysin family protein [Steroidobacteraceae bacterium]